MSGNGDHPLRYRLWYSDRVRTVRTDRLGLIDDISENRPTRIERIPTEGTSIRCATIGEHLRFIEALEVLEAGR